IDRDRIRVEETLGDGGDLLAKIRLRRRDRELDVLLPWPTVVEVAVADVDAGPPHEIGVRCRRKEHGLARVVRLQFRRLDDLAEADIRCPPCHRHQVADLQVAQVSPIPPIATTHASRLSRIDKCEERVVLGDANPPRADLDLEDLLWPFGDPSLNSRRTDL